MIEVLFTCHDCGAKGVAVPVRNRRPGEPLGPWMEDVKQAVGYAHRKHNLFCRSREVDLKVPLLNEAKGVGYEAEKSEP